MRFKLAVVGIAVIVAALAVPAWSHHSHGNYTQETKDFEGVVTEVHALNPHSWVYMNITDAAGNSGVGFGYTIGQGGSAILELIQKELLHSRGPLPSRLQAWRLSANAPRLAELLPRAPRHQFLEHAERERS